jgi:hypothetical protein
VAIELQVLGIRGREQLAAGGVVQQLAVQRRLAAGVRSTCYGYP